MEYLYVVLGLLVLYLFMNKCGCRRIEGLKVNACKPNKSGECPLIEASCGNKTWYQRAVKKGFGCCDEYYNTAESCNECLRENQCPSNWHSSDDISAPSPAPPLAPSPASPPLPPSPASPPLPPSPSTEKIRGMGLFSDTYFSRKDKGECCDIGDPCDCNAFSDMLKDTLSFGLIEDGDGNCSEHGHGTCLRSTL